MTTEQFCYWLQGFIEISNPEALTKEQTRIIKDHLLLVFNKVTPDRNIYKSNFFNANDAGIIKYRDIPPASC